MNRHERVKDLFLRCCELDAERRAEVLAADCAGDDALRSEVEAMLDFDARRPDFLAGHAAGALHAAWEAEEAPLPHSIGPFRVLRRLGAGGMGIVFEALQDHPRRAVALKLLHAGLAGPRLQRRFEQEGELLARLDHPGIARVYGAGAVRTELGSQPWLAMELVRGVPLTRWARARSATPRDCLDLLARVCDAVQHAHERGVVHRDLKPANILVDDSGQPRVLDFGIARATDADVRFTTLLTGADEIVGTLAYMSPEQAAGDTSAVDERSDVYSLGVILHELLAGELPYEVSTRSLPDAVAVIRDEDPRRLGEVRREFRGDIETIALAALEKEPRRRYASAAALAADIRRYLDHLPIEARPPSRTYVWRKFVRRHRVPVVAACIVFVALAAGLASSLSYAFSEAAAHDRANSEAAAAAARELALQSSLLATQLLLDAGSFEAARAQLQVTPEELRGLGFGLLEHRLNNLLGELAVPDLWHATFLDDERVLAVDDCGTAFEWDVLTGEVESHAPVEPGARPLALADDGRLLLSALDGLLVLTDPLGDATTVIPFPDGRPKDGWRVAAIAPGGRRLAVATEDDSLWLIERSPGDVPGDAAEVIRLAEPATSLSSLRFSACGQLLAAGAVKAVRLYDCDQRVLRWQRPESQTVYFGLAFEPSTAELITGCGGGMGFFDLEEGRETQRWSRYEVKLQGLGAPFDIACLPGAGCSPRCSTAARSASGIWTRARSTSN